MKKTIILEWLKILGGLVVFSFGVHLTIYANIGLAPWDSLAMGVANHTPLNFGVATMCISLTVLLIDLAMKERIGFGTIIDAFCTGNIIQVFNYANPLPENHNLWLGIGIMIVGFVFMALGMWIYMSMEQCCGPRDALLVGLGRRMPKIPIGIVQVLLWGTIVLIAYILDGPIGIGTVLGAFGAGIVLQLVYNVIKFEPRDMKHRDVIQIIKLLKQAD